MRKTVVHIILLLFLIGSSIQSFSQTYFNKKIDVRGEVDEGRGGIVSTDSGYVVCCATIYNGNIGVGLISLNLLGDTLYTKWYGKDFSGYYTGTSGSFRKTLTNGYTLGGSFKDTSTGLISFGLLVRFDNNLDTLWSKKYGDGIEDHIFNQAIQTSDSGFICVGSVYVGSSIQTWLMKVDSLGNFEWEKTFGGANTEIGGTVIQTSDGGYLIGAISNSTTCNGGYDSWIIKTDSNGNQQWSKCYGGSFNDSEAVMGHEFPDGDYIFVGGRNYFAGNWYKNSVTRIQSNNTVEWYREYGQNATDAILQSVKVMPNGDIISVGNSAPYGIILRIRENGDSLWYHNYEYDMAIVNSLTDFDITPDGGIIAMGTTYLGGQDVWIIKLDKFGCLEPNCAFQPYIPQVDFVTNGFVENEYVGSINLFPNPNVGTFSLQYENGINAEVSFVIYDAIGKNVYEELLQDGMVTKELNLSLSSGIYEWGLSVNNTYINKGKLVIYD